VSDEEGRVTNVLPASIKIRLPLDRDDTGSIWIEDGERCIVAGPFRVAGRCADSIAQEHGNPSRTPTLPYGDPPTGHYKVKSIATSGAGSRYRSDLYGRGGAIVLLPLSGDAALADANGRFEILIHGGALSPDGRLRATSGHFRVADADLAALVAGVEQANGSVLADCHEVRASGADAEAVADEVSTSDLCAADTFSLAAAAPIRPAPRHLVAFGEYSPQDMTPIDQRQGAQVSLQAGGVANAYAGRQVTYQMGGDASQGGKTSDCSHFVNDVLSQAGLDIPHATAHDMADSEYFDEVPTSEARAGDIIVQGGHMGIYSGTNDTAGHPIGTPVGNHAGTMAPWGSGGWFLNQGDLTFYRPKQ
jgi:hypothetical protein